jgi:hypothetical protein
MWSLGCVFLEMATTLFGRTHRDMLDFYSKHGTENPHSISLNLNGTEQWIQHLRESAHVSDLVVLEWTSQMLQLRASERPTAGQLRGKILDTHADFDYICHECSSKSAISGDYSRGPFESGNHNNLAPNHAPLRPEITQQSSPKLTLQTAHEVDHGAQDSPPPRYTAKPDPPEQYLDEAPKPGISGKSETKQPVHKKLRFADDNQTSDKDSTDKNSARTRVRDPKRQYDASRFTALPEDRRPEPIDSQQPEERNVDEDERFCVPEPVKSPPFRGVSDNPLPESTLVPSYILAGANHMTRQEVERPIINENIFNVFMYGRVLFPAVLHGLASHSIDGIYAPDLQRRIFPVSADWNKANQSIQRASEIMTPAVLHGHDRWKCPWSDAAAILPSSFTEGILQRRNQRKHRKIDPPGHVVGHLIVGLKLEAVRYLDLLLASTAENMMSRDFRPVKSEEGIRAFEKVRSPFQRTRVTVDVELLGGEITQAEAFTYTWKERPKNFSRRWKEDSFVRGRSFQGLFGSNKAWMEQEQALATTMRISYALPGDVVCGAILSEDVDKVNDLLNQGHSANEPCRVYDTLLQAAVVTGNEDIVELLIEHDARVNATGGPYGTALIAASFASRKSITRLLLDKGADVFATDSKYVNALYQAVGHSDYAIVEMLLDHAAWLVDDWGEVCDLAMEMGDKEIQRLLRQYDVRHLARQEGRTRKVGELENRPQATKSGLIEKRPSKSLIFRAVVTKIATVQAMTGHWKGRKGVAVVVAALNAGASPSILKYLRQAVYPVQMLLAELQKRDEEDLFSGRSLDNVEENDVSFAEYGDAPVIDQRWGRAVS